MSDDESPAMVLIPPTTSDPAVKFVLRRKHSPGRVAIVGERADLFADAQVLEQEAMKHCWPGLLASVRARGIKPEGEWILLVIPADFDWREIVEDEIARKIDARLATDERLAVLFVAEIVDSAAIEAWPLAMLS